MKTVQIKHGVYDIKSRGGHARAFLSRGRPGAGFIAEAKEETDEAAIMAVKETLAREEANRPVCKSYRIATPTQKDFERALAAVPLSPSVEAMMKALVAAGEKGMTASALARAAGYGEYASANLHLGTASRKLAEVLGMTLPKAISDDERDVATALIAYDGVLDTESGHWTWCARREFIAAWTLK